MTTPMTTMTSEEFTSLRELMEIDRFCKEEMRNAFPSAVLGNMPSTIEHDLLEYLRERRIKRMTEDGSSTFWSGGHRLDLAHATGTFLYIYRPTGYELRGTFGPPPLSIIPTPRRSVWQALME